MAMSLEIVREMVLSRFARVAYSNKDRIQRAWLISPWLAKDGGREDPISFLVEALRRADSRVYVVTRPPETRWHLDAVTVLHRSVAPLLFYCRNLHTKLYLLECDGFRYAMLGSPNLTGRANVRSRELAVEFRTSMQSREDQVAYAVTNLITYARGLIAEDGVELVDDV